MTAAAARRGPVEEAFFLCGALVRNRALAIRRDWTSRSLYGFAILVGAAVFFTILIGTFAGVRVLRAASAYELLESIPAWAFLVYLFTDILIAFGQALGDLYLSRDMPILLAMPLRLPSIVFAKFVLGVAQNDVYAALFLLPFATGYLAGLGAPLWTFAAAAAGVFVFPATLYAALIVITIVALRIIPPKIAKEGLWLIGASVPTVFWFLSFYRVSHVTGDIASMRLPAPPDWLPSTWAGNAIAMFGAGDSGGGLSWLWVLFAATFVACPVALAIVARGFARGWSMASSTPARRIGRDAVSRGATTPAGALVLKDLLTFVRSPQLWFNHIAALGFVGYLIVGHSVQTPLLPLTVQLAMVQVGFVAALGALNPGMTALSLEHRAVWVLKSAPIPPDDILASKFRVAFLQTGAVVTAGAIALAYGYGFGPVQGAALVTFALVSSAMSVMTGLAFDAAHPSFDWENPNHINRGLRMIVPLVTNLGTLAACALLLFGFRAAVHGLAGSADGFFASLTLLFVVAWWSARAARRDVAALEV